MISVRCLAAITASRPSARCHYEELQSPPSHQKASGEEEDYHSGAIGKLVRGI
jgi:hypothetical protein